MSFNSTTSSGASSTFDMLDDMLDQDFQKQMRVITKPKAPRVVCFPSMSECAKEIRTYVDKPQGIIDTARAKIRELSEKCAFNMQKKKNNMRTIVERLSNNTDSEMYDLLDECGNSDDVKMIVNLAKELRHERGGGDDTFARREREVEAMRAAKEAKEEAAALRRQLRELKDRSVPTNDEEEDDSSIEDEDEGEEYKPDRKEDEEEEEEEDSTEEQQRVAEEMQRQLDESCSEMVKLRQLVLEQQQQMEQMLAARPAAAQPAAVVPGQAAANGEPAGKRPSRNGSKAGSRAPSPHESELDKMIESE